MLIQSARRYSQGALLLSLAGLLLLLVAGVSGWFDGPPVAPPAASGEAAQRPGMRGVHLYEGLGAGVTLHLEAISIEPAPGRLGAFVSWLKPIAAVSDARVVIDGPAGEQVIITGRECNLSKDGRTIVFDKGVRWQRTDQAQDYACRRLSLNLDAQAVAFESRVRLQGPERTTWQPFQMTGFFSPFPTPTGGDPASVLASDAHGTAPFPPVDVRGAHDESPLHEPH